MVRSMFNRNSLPIFVKQSLLTAVLYKYQPILAFCFSCTVDGNAYLESRAFKKTTVIYYIPKLQNHSGYVQLMMCFTIGSLFILLSEIRPMHLNGAIAVKTGFLPKLNKRVAWSLMCSARVRDIVYKQEQYISTYFLVFAWPQSAFTQVLTCISILIFLYTAPTNYQAKATRARF